MDWNNRNKECAGIYMEDNNNEADKPNAKAQKAPEPVSRRKFFGDIGKAAAGAAVIGIMPTLDSGLSVSAQRGPTLPFPALARAKKSYEFRKGMATANYLATPASMRRLHNGDEDYFANYIASFTKGLPHQANGEVEHSAYSSLKNALESENPANLETVPLGGDRKFVNPQSGLAMDLEGRDSFSLLMPPAPNFSSREVAAEIAENYWMALLRDVPFEDYSGNPIAADAAADLNLYGNDFRGPKNGSGQVTPDLLFRGLTSGDKLGPHFSQFFYLPCFFGANEVSQKINTVRPIADGGQDYMTDFASWLSVQNGITPAATDILDPTPRYLRMGRDIGQYVHVDVLFQSYFQAFLILTGTLNADFDGGNPYANSATQEGFASFGGPHAAALLCEIATRGLKGVWNQKWFVHRRLRPEVYACRVDRTLHHGAGYQVHPDILNSISSAKRLGGHLPAGNALLPMAFPEGSPMHPSYGAGHATVAGACATILKAFFDESTIIENPVAPDPTGQFLVPYSGGDVLTVGGEINKLASNISLGRNVAGVHWRSDCTESLRLGERIAISVLSDQKASFTEDFGGFTITKFDGTTVVV